MPGAPSADKIAGTDGVAPEGYANDQWKSLSTYNASRSIRAMMRGALSFWGELAWMASSSHYGAIAYDAKIS